jgi:chromosomal replication initiator protein
MWGLMSDREEVFVSEVTLDLPRTIRALWERSLEAIKDVASAADFEHWISPLAVVAERDGKIVIAAKDKLAFDRVKNDHLQALQRAWHTADDKGRTLQLVNWRMAPAELRQMVDDPWRAAEEAAAASACAPEELAAPERREDGTATFETLVTGPSNNIASELARRIALGQPVGTRIAHIFGEPGTGKTHIARALKHLSDQTHTSRLVVHLTAEEFLSAYQEGAFQRDTRDLKRRLRAAQVLVIDDLHRIAGMQKTEIELVQNLREVTNQGGMVVLISDRPQNDSHHFGPRLRNELKGAVSAEIGLPDTVMRTEIVRRIARQIEASTPSFHLSDAMIAGIVADVRGPGRELVGAVWSLFTETSFGELPLTDEILQRVTRRQTVGDNRKLSIQNVKQATNKVFNLSKGDLESQSRVQTLVYPRQLAMFLSRQLTGRSYPQIGLAFGGRNHATVLYACRQIAEKRKLMVEVETDIQRITQAVFDIGQSEIS